MKNRTASSKRASARSSRSTPAPQPTPTAAAVAAAPEAVAKKGVVVDGNTTTRHYGDGTKSTLIHATDEAAKDYAKSVKGAR